MEFNFYRNCGPHTIENFICESACEKPLDVIMEEFRKTVNKDKTVDLHIRPFDAQLKKTMLFSFK